MDRNSEKLGVDQIDDNTAYQTDSNILDHEFTPAEQKRIIQRIDRRLVTTVGFMYCVSLMDRTNLGAAVIAGMGVELKLIGERYVSSAVVSDAIPLSDAIWPVDHHPPLLRDLYHIPAALDHYLPFHRSEVPSCGNHPPLGLLYDWHGFCEEMGSTGWAQNYSGVARSWLLSQLRLSSQHVVHAM